MNSVNNIVITGSTRGLGLSHAKYLAQSGYNIALIDISKEACEVYGEVSSINQLLEKLKKYSVKVKFFECDLTDLEATKKAFEKIIDDFGAIEGLVLNAGGDVMGKDNKASGGKAEKNTIDISIKNHDEIFNRNYYSCLNSIKAILPHFRENKFGKIITTSSISAGYGAKVETAYAISKAAVIHLTRSVAVQLRPYNINVNCIAPGPTLTGRFKAFIDQRSDKDKEKIHSTEDSILMRPAEPEYISSVVGFLLSEDSKYISGQVIRIDGGQFTSPI
tara:strand:- start:9 stop:836 length:828 start_codon:yes stop_codon:yes gene_type:complete